MKKAISVLLVFVMVISLCACGAETVSIVETKPSPDERVEDEIKEYISTNFRLSIDDAVSEPVSVTINDITKSSGYKWFVLGTYTVKINGKIMSAQFFMNVAYDEASDTFTFSDESIDQFK